MDTKKTTSKTSEQRKKQVMKTIDRIAADDGLAFVTTQKVSKLSKISDGVLFRHYSSKEAMLSAWVEARSEQLRLGLDAMPAGRDGLMYFLHDLLQNQALLSFIYCLPVDILYLRQAMEKSRARMYKVLEVRIELLASTPSNVPTNVLTDHLMQTLYRIWTPNHPEKEVLKERLMTQLPWENIEDKTDQLPSPDALKQLALNDSGFVFDPVSGKSFTANVIGLYVLRFLQHNSDTKMLFQAIEKDFDVSQTQAERDLNDFFAQLRKFFS